MVKENDIVAIYWPHSGYHGLLGVVTGWDSGGLAVVRLNNPGPYNTGHIEIREDKLVVITPASQEESTLIRINRLLDDHGVPSRVSLERRIRDVLSKHKMAMEEVERQQREIEMIYESLTLILKEAVRLKGGR